MELATFIRESLVQIARGIDEANSALASTSARVNPRGISPSPKGDTKFYGYLVEEHPSGCASSRKSSST